jgi:hypothetical protein
MDRKGKKGKNGGKKGKGKGEATCRKARRALVGEFKVKTKLPTVTEAGEEFDLSVPAHAEELEKVFTTGIAAAYDVEEERVTITKMGLERPEPTEVDAEQTDDTTEDTTARNLTATSDVEDHDSSSPLRQLRSWYSRLVGGGNKNKKSKASSRTKTDEDSEDVLSEKSESTKKQKKNRKSKNSSGKKSFRTPTPDASDEPEMREGENSGDHLTDSRTKTTTFRLLQADPANEMTLAVEYSIDFPEDAADADVESMALEHFGSTEAREQFETELLTFFDAAEENETSRFQFQEVDAENPRMSEERFPEDGEGRSGRGGKVPFLHIGAGVLLLMAATYCGRKRGCCGGKKRETERRASLSRNSGSSRDGVYAVAWEHQPNRAQTPPSTKTAPFDNEPTFVVQGTPAQYPQINGNGPTVVYQQPQAYNGAVPAYNQSAFVDANSNAQPAGPYQAHQGGYLNTAGVMVDVAPAPNSAAPMAQVNQQPNGPMFVYYKDRHGVNPIFFEPPTNAGRNTPPSGGRRSGSNTPGNQTPQTRE